MIHTTLDPRGLAALHTAVIWVRHTHHICPLGTAPTLEKLLNSRALFNGMLLFYTLGMLLGSGSVTGPADVNCHLDLLDTQ